MRGVDTRQADTVKDLLKVREIEDGLEYYAPGYEVVTNTKSMGSGFAQTIGDNRIAITVLRQGQPNPWFLCEGYEIEYSHNNHGFSPSGGSNSQLCNWVGSDYYTIAGDGTARYASGDFVSFAFGRKSFRADFHVSDSTSEVLAWCVREDDRVIYTEDGWFTLDSVFPAFNGEWHEIARVGQWIYFAHKGLWYRCRLDGSDAEDWEKARFFGHAVSHPSFSLDGRVVYGYKGKLWVATDSGEGLWSDFDTNYHHGCWAEKYLVASDLKVITPATSSLRIYEAETGNSVWVKDIRTNRDSDRDFNAWARPAISYDGSRVSHHCRVGGECVVRVYQTGLRDTEPDTELERLRKENAAMRNDFAAIDHDLRAIESRCGSARRLCDKWIGYGFQERRLIRSAS